MDRSELLNRWRARRDEFRRLDAMVGGERLCAEIVQDLEILEKTEGGGVLTLTQAAEHSGYSRAHLGRLVRAGRLHNVGRPNAPKIRACDLPRKPGHTPLQRADTRHQITSTSKGQIVRSIVGRERTHDD